MVWPINSEGTPSSGGNLRGVDGPSQLRQPAPQTKGSFPKRSFGSLVFRRLLTRMEWSGGVRRQRSAYLASSGRLLRSFGIARKVAKKYRVLREAWWTPSLRLSISRRGRVPAWGTNHVGEEWEPQRACLSEVSSCNSQTHRIWGLAAG